MPWVSDRARTRSSPLLDTDLLPPEADQDRRELAAIGIRSMVVGTSGRRRRHVRQPRHGGHQRSARGRTSHVADFRLLNAALTSRIALEQARRSLADAVAAGAQTREAQQHFFASVGHELRTPLTAIVGYTEMLVDEAEQQETDPFAEAVGRDGAVILRACEQLMAVVEDLLSAGRTMGTEEIRQSVDVAAAVEDVLHWHRTTARAAERRAGLRGASRPDRVGARRRLPAGAVQPHRQRGRAQPGRDGDRVRPRPSAASPASPGSGSSSATPARGSPPSSCTTSSTRSSATPVPA